jgi:hypothetical protein
MDQNNSPAEQPEDNSPEKKSSTDKEEKKSSSEKATILEEELKNLPPEAQQMMHMFMSRERYIGPLPNPIASKINEKHIDTVLENSEKDSEREFKSGIHQKYFSAFIIIVFVGLFIFLTIWLSEKNKDLYMDILKIVIGFLGGFGSGYGIKAYRDKNKD